MHAAVPATKYLITFCRMLVHFINILLNLVISFFRVKSAVTGSVFCLETEDVEAAVAKAVAAGAVSEDEISEGEGGCCGGRVGKVKDPYGNVWLICTPSKTCGDVAA